MLHFDKLIHSEQSLHVADGTMQLFITCSAKIIDNIAIRVPSEELAEIAWVNEKTLGNYNIYDNCVRALEAYWK
jgi:hypothetical protein